VSMTEISVAGADGEREVGVREGKSSNGEEMRREDGRTGKGTRECGESVRERERERLFAVSMKAIHRQIQTMAGCQQGTTIIAGHLCPVI